MSKKSLDKKKKGKCKYVEPRGGAGYSFGVTGLEGVT